MEVYPRLIDRLVFAAEIAKKKRVLDIGGRGMPAPPEGVKVYGPSSFSLKQTHPDQSTFARTYQRIGQGASEYRILDARNEPDVNYVVNLSQKGCVETVRGIISDYKPEVILCMETLEHANYHFEIMNEMARAVSEYGSTVFITIPNNGNWILNMAGWNHDHCVGFFPGIATRFVTRSDLGAHNVTFYRCFQQYLWYWRFAYAVSFFQPFSLGFLVQPKGK
jgi:hypothetical protein